MFDWFPSTFSVACFVCVGALIHNLFVNQYYCFYTDVLLHYVPVIVYLALAVLVSSYRLRWVWSVLVCTVLAYVAFHAFNVQEIMKFYTEKQDL